MAAQEDHPQDSQAIDITEAFPPDSGVTLLRNSAGEPVGLAFAPDTTYEEWKACGEKLIRSSRATRWLVGDWLEFFKDKPGGPTHKDKEAEELFGYTRGALYNITWLCAAWPAEFRDLSIPILIYEILTPLARTDFEQAKTWLQRARAEAWTGAQLTAELKGLPAPKPEEHASIEWRLLTLGSQLGFDLWLAQGDASRLQRAGHIEEFQTIDVLPQLAPGNERAQQTINFIDVIWLNGVDYVAAFEVEKTSSIYSGILRLSDLAAVLPNLRVQLYIVAPEGRRGKVFEELNRPTFRQEHLRLNKLCRLITFERLISETERLGDWVRAMRPLDFLDAISESCELVETIIPDDEET